MGGSTTSKTTREIPAGGLASRLKRTIESLGHCLGWRLIFILTITLMALLSTSGGLALRLQRQHLYDLLAEHAEGIGRTILSSTRAAMLDNDRHGLQRIIRNVGDEDRVLALRLVNAEGTVIYSSAGDEVGQTADLSAPACQGCHGPDGNRNPKGVEDRLHLYSLPSGAQALGLAVPVMNEPACWEAGCHVHDRETEVLGLLDVEISTAGLEESLASQRHQTIVLGLASIIIVCTIIGLVSWRVVHRPVHQLLDGTRSLAVGDMNYRIPPTSTGEIAELAESFNAMADNLGAAHAELERWGNRLERRVDEKSRQLEQTRDHLVFTEKMVSLGRLAAVVAHEINNPLAGILVSVKLVRRRLVELPKKTPSGRAAEVHRVDESLGMVERETARCGDIVRNLLLFSRQRSMSLALANVHELVERCLQLVAHQAELSSVELTRDFDPGLPEVVCDSSQIEQACLVLLLNALDAMPDGGELTIRTLELPDGKGIRVEVRDTGIGIDESLRPRVFEPFFSTKNEGEGTGLGLSVLYGIVQRHQGNVDFRSAPDEGTLFWFDLPIIPETAEPNPTAPPTSTSAGGP